MISAPWYNTAEALAPYRRVLWVVLGINAGMFLVEISAGLAARSVSLQADALAQILKHLIGGTVVRHLVLREIFHG